MIAIIVTDAPYLATLDLTDDVALALRRNDPDARRVALAACEVLLDALIETHAAARHEMN